jgi:hypothetical protein
LLLGFGFFGKDIADLDETSAKSGGFSPVVLPWFGLVLACLT